MMTDDNNQSAAALMAKLRIRFALAHAELDAHQNELGIETKTITFLPMAAKTDKPGLPEEITSQEDGEYTIKFEVEGNKINVTVEPLGYLAADEIAGRQAYLVSFDAHVYYEFRFDVTGNGVIVLNKDSDTVEALRGGCQVHVGR